MVMQNRAIPAAQYERLAEQFNPTQFDAREWVALAKDRGGPQVLDSLAASLRWSPSRVVMPPFRGFGHRGAAPSW